MASASRSAGDRIRAPMAQAGRLSDVPFLRRQRAQPARKPHRIAGRRSSPEQLVGRRSTALILVAKVSFRDRPADDALSRPDLNPPCALEPPRPGYRRRFCRRPGLVCHLQLRNLPAMPDFPDTFAGVMKDIEDVAGLD